MNKTYNLFTDISDMMDEIYEDMNIWERIRADILGVMRSQNLVYGEIKITRKLILDIIKKHIGALR